MQQSAPPPPGEYVSNSRSSQEINRLRLVEHEGSLLHSHPATNHYLQLDECSSHLHIHCIMHFNIIFPSTPVSPKWKPFFGYSG
jgi:hypothetical protein